jgi:hypothetical protein
MWFRGNFVFAWHAAKGRGAIPHLPISSHRCFGNESGETGNPDVLVGESRNFFGFGQHVGATSFEKGKE